MAGEIVSGGFAGFGIIKTLAIYGGVFILFLIVAAIITSAVIYFVVQSKRTKVYTIGMVNRKIDIQGARLKKNKIGSIKQLWLQKDKKYLPDVQQEDMYIKGKADSIILLKDRNGMMHTARIPNYDEIKKWYQVVHGIDITKEDSNEKIREVYLLPNPHEDLDWLAGLCTEADREFSIDSWWKSPIVAYVATGFICFLMVIMTLIITKKM